MIAVTSLRIFGMFSLLFALQIEGAMARDPLTIDPATKTSFDAIEQTLLRTIPAYLDDAQCGGQQLDTSVGDTLGEGAIADVTGVPGRRGSPLKNIPSGMGVRNEEGGALNDGYEYPASAEGLSTRCPLKTSSLRKTLWSYSRISWMEFPFIETPYFEDPPCQWRDGKRQDGAMTTGSCAEFCSILNTAEYADCWLIAGNREQGFYCKLWCMKSTCTDGWTNTCNTSLSTLTNGAFPDSPIPEGVTDIPLDPEFIPLPEPAFQNCRTCKGDECRCEMPEAQGGENTDDGSFSKDPSCPLSMQIPDIDVGAPNFSLLTPDDAVLLTACRTRILQAIKDGDVAALENLDFSVCSSAFGRESTGITGGVYGSFFRSYQPSYKRRAFAPPSPAFDRPENSGQVACYGFYDEFDLLHHQTKPKDRRCVMHMPIASYVRDLAGQVFSQSSSAPSFDPNARASAPFDASQDLWFKRLGGAFSFLSERVFFDRYNGQIAPAIGEALSDFGSLQPLASTVAREERAFDDTGAARSVVRWIEGLQHAMNIILTPPTVQLLLPKTSIFALDPRDPLFVGSSVAKVDTLRDPRALSMEIQLRARDDIAGDVTAFLERTIFGGIEEHAVPVSLPQASPQELRALAQAWCQAVLERTKAQSCDDAPPDVQRFINSLLAWSDSVETVRLLRTEHLNILTQLLDYQRDISAVLSTWATKNKAALTLFLDQRRRLLPLRKDWIATERLLQHFSNVVNMPHCMNQRFTLPVLHLLDPWLPGRENGGSLDGNGLPVLPTLAPSRDIIFDVSRFILALQRPLRVPVLKPTLIHLDLPSLAPPRLGKPFVAPTLPPFPSIEALKMAFKNALALPEADATVLLLEEAPVLIPPTTLTDEEIAAMRERMTAIRSVIEGMSASYSDFWQNVDLSEEENLTELPCDDWNDGHCIFPEPNLLEGIMRIGSRPHISLLEDTLPPLAKRTVPNVCVPGDSVCVLLPGEERTIQSGWQLLAPSSESQERDATREAMIDATLPLPLGTQPPASLPPYAVDLNRILQGYNIPADSDILPPSSSRSPAP